MKLLDRVRKKWNVFTEVEKTEHRLDYNQPVSHRRPDRSFYSTVRGKEITNAIYNRISVDCANVDIKHVKLDEDGRFSKIITNSTLNDCLNFEANTDQSGFALKQDMVQTMLEEGTVVIVPTDTDTDPETPGSTTILTLRVGTIVEWMPSEVKVRLYRESSGRFEELKLPKRFVAIAENPFYTVMNEHNSTLKRLTRKISLLDAVDEQIGSGKLDLIIQLPYVVKSDTKRNQAEKRRSDLEAQLQTSQYGVAYADGTEKIVQLNRPVENNLLKNVEALTKMLYTQLGVTEEVVNGTASEEAMLNYQSRIIKPILKSLVEAMRRAFLTKTARTQGQTLDFFQDHFSLVPLSKLADIVDKLSRNAIVVPNEIRPLIGFPPLPDAVANELSNKNMPTPPMSEPPELLGDEESPIE